MIKKLYPKMYFNKLLDIPLEELKEKNIKAFILDLDNTITEWNSNEITEDVGAWFKEVKKRGFKACILSNNHEKRILQVANTLDIPFIHRAQKPRRGAFYSAVELLGLQKEEVAVIGDQIFTDILGGNRAGLFTILLVPINKKEFPGTKISRAMEYFVLKRINKTKR